MVEPCGGTEEQWNSDAKTVEQSWWNKLVEQWNIHGVTVWWNSGTVMVEQWNSGTLMVEQCNETVEH